MEDFEHLEYKKFFKKIKPEKLTDDFKNRLWYLTCSTFDHWSNPYNAEEHDHDAWYTLYTFYKLPAEKIEVAELVGWTPPNDKVVATLALVVALLPNMEVVLLSVDAPKLKLVTGLSVPPG